MESEDKGRKLNWAQACKLLGCKKSHFYNLVASGQIPGYRYGRVKGIRVFEQDCQIYLSRKYSHLHNVDAFS